MNAPKLLRNQNDWRSLVFVLAYFLLVTAQWLGFFNNLFLTVFFIFITCLISWVGAVITHNTLHCPVFYKRIWNRIFQVVLTLTYGFPVSEYIPGHNMSHHRYTQTRKDVMRTTKVQFRSNFLNFILFFVVVAVDVTRANYRFVKLMKKQKPIWYRQLLIEGGFCWGSKLVLLMIDWQKCLLYIIIPHAFAVWAITTINYFQHDGCDATSPYNHSRNFVGRAFNWFFFNNGFHGVHHMRPGLHWSLLPKKHAEILGPYIHPALEQKSFFKYLFESTLFPGKRVNFDGTPVLLPQEGADEDWIGLGSASVASLV